ncbi:hypothetical protein [Acetobacter persici]|uniref:Uncharacterized protein n=1 Tax=Acetobacter persici TaxID=1076596 RepID=A0A1U9LJJ2_9PROT|nr:hypothetical protein [Acetobacter persici]AQT06568.1 hypothetical protein A0U91_16300 [Acetobacter persici]
MQTISIPYQTSTEGRTVLTAWRRGYGAIVRSACQALRRDAGTALKELTTTLYDRHRVSGIDHWLAHCAVLEAAALPEKDIVFGGKGALQRRQKGLISNEQWKALRLRPMTSIGVRNFKGNRHFRLSDGGRACTVTVLKKPVVLHLPEMRGTWGEIIRALALLAPDKEISIQFRIDSHRLHLTFDEMDLRRLQPGETLTLARDRDQAASGRRARGRGRGPGYVAPRPRTSAEARPVHPQWRTPVPAAPGRALGIDLNPNFIGLTVIENRGDPIKLSDCKVLDSECIRLDIPQDASDDLTREILSRAAGHAVRLARKWNAGLITLEHGLGKLRSRTKNRALNRLINFWGRSVILASLTRRARLAGLTVSTVHAAWSSTIGNLVFDLPDPCAAAAEVARRGLARACDRNADILPLYEPSLIAPHDQWKDCAREMEILPDFGRLRGWVDCHGQIKTAQTAISRIRRGKDRVGYRRPLPAVMVGRSQVQPAGMRAGLAVRPLGRFKAPGTVFRNLAVTQTSTRYAG